MTIRTWGVIALLVCAGCKKNVDAASGAGGGSAAGSAAAYDPWDSPPAQADTALGAKTGDDLAKVAASTAVPAAALEVQDSAEQAATIKAIAQPTADTLAIKEFANVETSNGFKVTYNPSGNAAHDSYRQIFVQNRVFENVAEGLNKTVRVPSSIDIQTRRSTRRGRSSFSRT